MLFGIWTVYAVWNTRTVEYTLWTVRGMDGSPTRWKRFPLLYHLDDILLYSIIVSKINKAPVLRRIILVGSSAIDIVGCAYCYSTLGFFLYLFLSIFPLSLSFLFRVIPQRLFWKYFGSLFPIFFRKLARPGIAATSSPQEAIRVGSKRHFAARGCCAQFGYKKIWASSFVHSKKLCGPKELGNWLLVKGPHWGNFSTCKKCAWIRIG